MRRRTLLWVLTGFVALTAAFMGLTRISNAFYIRAGDNLAPRHRIDDTVYLAGRTIDLDSDVYGDVFCAGQNITISGTVHGDVICGGQNLTLNGKVDGDVRLAGQTITLSANVAGNATIGGQSLVITSTGSIGGDLSAGTGDTTINGKIGRDALIGGNKTIINGAVGRNIKAQSSQFQLGSQARVNGNIALTSEHTVKREAGAVVTGKITRTVPKKHQGRHFDLAWFIFRTLAMLATAMVLALLFPRWLHGLSNRAVRRPWRTLLTGFIASIAWPIAIILLAITVVGIPLAIFTGLVGLVALFLTGPLAAYALGRFVLRNSTQPLLIMLVGAVLLLIGYAIPYVGFVVMAVAVWTGLGMLVQAAFRNTPKPIYNLADSPEHKS